MVKRLVKLTFKEELVPEFMDIFDGSQALIRNFPGCRHLELLQCTGQPAVLFTFSFWDDEESLDRYRQSELFQTTWRRTKALFADKAEAWTTRVAG